MKKASSSPSVIDPAFFSQCTLNELREHIQADGFFAGLRSELDNRKLKKTKDDAYKLPQGDLFLRENRCEFFVPVPNQADAWHVYHISVSDGKLHTSGTITFGPKCRSQKNIPNPPYTSEKDILSFLQKVLFPSPESSVPLVRRRTLAKMHARIKLK